MEEDEAGEEEIEEEVVRNKPSDIHWTDGRGQQQPDRHQQGSRLPRWRLTAIAIARNNALLAMFTAQVRLNQSELRISFKNKNSLFPKYQPIRTQHLNQNSVFPLSTNQN